MAWLHLRVDERQVFTPVESAAPRQSRPDDGVSEDGGVCGYAAVGSGHGDGSGGLVRRGFGSTVQATSGSGREGIERSVRPRG